MEPSDMIAAGSLAVAGGAFIYAFVQTSKANRRSLEANATAEQALAVARDGALDARKARLATGAPQIAVTAGEVEWPPLRKASIAAHSPGMAVAAGYEFRTPRDNDQPIGLRFTFSVQNLGADTTIGVVGVIAPGHEHYNDGRDAKPIRLAAGATETFVMEEYRSLSSWIEQTRTRENGQPGDVELTAWVRYDDGKDEGIIGIVNVRVPCNGLEAVPQDDAGWRFPNPLVIPPGQTFPPTLVAVYPTEIRYYSSKLRDESLGEIN
ncbi:hypothetical protein ACFV4M_01930 [Kitasatospora indigofera]|uniref:hypothetical protein n=1 Tax=Kitasatospora indigofera TaxID=67307 RepID=UPI0036556E89